MIPLATTRSTDSTADTRAVSGAPILELQSIRGLAACLVVVAHCISYYRAADWWTFVKRLVNSQTAVEVFFILSGFVLVRSLLAREINWPSLRTFYVKRVFRIYPALFVGSVLATLYVVFLHFQIPVEGISRWMSERFRADRMGLVYFVASYAGMLGFLIPPVWTIFVEIVASAFLPFLALLIQRQRAAFWGVLAVLALISLFSTGRIYYHLDIYLVDFAAGAALLLIDPDKIGVMHLSQSARRWLAVLCALLATCVRAFTTADVWSPQMHMFEAVLLATIIYLFGVTGLRSDALRSRQLVWLGDVSYSIYILHFPIMCTFAKIFAVIWPDAAPALGGWPLGLMLLVPTGIVTLWLSDLCFRFVERPGIVLGTQVSRRLAGSA